MPPITRRQPLQWLLAACLVGNLAACGGGADLDPSLRVDGQGISSFDASTLASALTSYPRQTPSTAEADSLRFMREEEELARAVYAASAQRWPTLPIFANIAASEATHTAAVKALLDRYELTDPLAGLTIGTFKSPSFQALYEALVAASRVSLIEALKVGVQIEELDLRDIALQKPSIDNADILLVYDNLERGSRNHLRAYMRTLLAQGGSYVPQYLSPSAFDAILQSPMETGR